MIPAQFNIEKLLAKYPHRTRASLLRLARWTDGVEISIDISGAPWKRWKGTEAMGLGDVVAKMTSAVGIKPCGGCKKRQAALNKLVPFGPQPPPTPPAADNGA